MPTVEFSYNEVGVPNTNVDKEVKDGDLELVCYPMSGTIAKTERNNRYIANLQVYA